jgi:hypothetical protein
MNNVWVGLAGVMAFLNIATALIALQTIAMAKMSKMEEPYATGIIASLICLVAAGFCIWYIISRLPWMLTVGFILAFLGAGIGVSFNKKVAKNIYKPPSSNIKQL